MDTKPEGKPAMSAETGMDVGVQTLKHRGDDGRVRFVVLNSKVRVNRGQINTAT
jgi:hypothetical protein